MSADLAAGWESSAAEGGHSNGRNALDNGCTTASSSTDTTAAAVLDSAPVIEWVWDVDPSVSGRVATDASWVQDMLLHLLTNAKQVSTQHCYELYACSLMQQCDKG
jgi:hypothetical protein